MSLNPAPSPPTAPLLLTTKTMWSFGGGGGGRSYKTPNIWVFKVGHTGGLGRGHLFLLPFTIKQCLHIVYHIEKKPCHVHHFLAKMPNLRSLLCEPQQSRGVFQLLHMSCGPHLMTSLLLSFCSIHALPSHLGLAPMRSSSAPRSMAWRSSQEKI